MERLVYRVSSELYGAVDGIENIKDFLNIGFFTFIGAQNDIVYI